MMVALARRLRRLGRDERGFSLVEFCAVAPFLGLMIVGVADLGRGYTTRFALQQAVNRTLEMAQQGTRRNNYDFLATEAASAADVPAASVALEQWLECDGTRKLWTETCTTAQQTARYVKLTVRKPFDPLFTTAGYPNVQPDGTVRLEAHASLRVQ